MAVTRKDVARMAQVSEATVSYVMNNTKKITPEVRRRVLDAAKALNYHPSLLAKSLVTKETRHIAMLVDNVQNPHYGSILSGVQHVAAQDGYIVSILSMNYPTKEAMTELAARGVDGVILALGTAGIAEYERLIADLTLPVVYEGGALVTSYRTAIFDMVKCFKKFGHRRIAFLSGLPLSGSPHIRCQDFLDALTCYGLEVCSDLFIDGDGRTDEAAGYDAISRLMKTRQEFTAVFALNDLMATGALNKLWEAGLQVPDDVSVVGCDGISGTAYTVPPLSTIQTHAYSLGESLMRQLLYRLHPEQHLPDAGQVIEAEFILRESVSACAGNES